MEKNLLEKIVEERKSPLLTEIRLFFAAGEKLGFPE
jgi:hypothetical protein